MLDYQKRGGVLNTIYKTRACGFSLIELLIGVAVLSVLISLAVPGMRAWLKNAEIRNAAESIQNGLQRARAEALLRNKSVEFVLAAKDSDCQNTKECTSWEVKEAGVGGISIEKRSSKEGSADVKRTTTPANMTTVTFNNVGGRVSNPATDFSTVTLSSAVLGTSSHELKVIIGVKDGGGNYVGGTVRMCDPSLTSGPRAC
jgi:type IV fimbrial biogenesis protein FimT